MGKSTDKDARKHARTPTSTREISLRIPTDDPNDAQGPTTAAGGIDNARTSHKRNRLTRATDDTYTTETEPDTDDDAETAAWAKPKKCQDDINGRNKKQAISKTEERRRR